MDQDKTEKKFEDAIEEWLTSSGAGYAKSKPTDFDLAYGIDTVQLFAFIQETQSEKWTQVVTRYGGNEEKARDGFLSRVAKELDNRGTPEVLRTEVSDQGVKIKLAYFRPATSMNDTLAKGYAANRLSVTRQLRYSTRHNNNTIDVALLLNGILVATAELKNPLTGQNVNNAMEQYRNDRDAKADPYLARAVVHFAVDPYLVFMTTELAGGDTNFLPFNQGKDGGKGNPSSLNDFDTAYLWQTIWSHDVWLDILGRFVQRDEKNRNIFPRYHQWAAVTSLEADAKQKGAGHSYLIQHSPGAGKSNSISWLAHRLSTLHNAADKKVFDKVIVITDRRILDSQLRENVRQFERTQGVVQAVEGRENTKTQELTEALTSATARIVITTLQTFPFILDQVGGAALGGKQWAVIIDEAHSSQTGDAANALRGALGSGVNLPDDVDPTDAMAEVLASRGVQPNISFFAFTATPKDKTVEVFGTLRANGVKGPFHLYSMRQAREEGFIMDVLENFTSWKTYYRLAAANNAAAQKEVDVSKAGSALRRVLVRHPEVISQKARIMVEHFVNHTAKKIGGRAKAIVVTDSRHAAVKYKEAIDAYIAGQGYAIKSLVAFSGSVIDEVAGEVTESSMNGIPESKTADAFKGIEGFKPGDYQVLIVAEKFQTGFDEPLLHTMFVDKVLTGLAAVQTLSRLNRIAPPDKTDTFVLDFRNEPEDIQKAFQRYYEATLTQATDPNVLADAYARAFALPVLDAVEVTDVVNKHFTKQQGSSLGKVYASFSPALARFAALDVEEQEEFRAALSGFLHLYSFLSQVLPWTDVDNERLYIFGRALARLLPSIPDGQLNLGSDVVLTHLRLEDQGATDIELESGGAAPGTAFPGEGRSHARDVRLDTLGNITEDLNQHFGLNLTERDRLVFEQFEVSWFSDQDLRAVARANNLEGFRLEFEKIFKNTILDNEEANRDLYERLNNDERFSARVRDWYLTRMYELFRAEEVQPRLALGEPAGTEEN
jgi:type I restriction enzyme R subunit